MNLVTGVVVFIIIWWVVLFMVLPFGVNRTANPEAGHDRGAPARPMVFRKVLITSGIAILLWGIFYLAVTKSGLSLIDLANRFAL